MVLNNDDNLYSKTGVYTEGYAYISYFCSKTSIMGTCENYLNETIQKLIHYPYFEQKKISLYFFASENYHCIAIKALLKLRSHQASGGVTDKK